MNTKTIYLKHADFTGSRDNLLHLPCFKNYAAAGEYMSDPIEMQRQNKQ